jgi:mannitol-1-phosphate 5-dehydrogenase
MRTDIGGCPKRAVVFGAGKMACGLLGELLYRAGFETFFVARSRNIASIDRQKGYFVGLAGGEPRQMRVRNCKAFAIAEPDAIVEAVAMADIVFTAVGIDNIPAIAPVVAEGLSRRLDHAGQPLNVIAAENLPGTGAYLRHQIIGAASLEKSLLLKKYVGFSAALTHRIMTGGSLIDGMLHFAVDAPGDLVIDRRGLIEPMPEIPHSIISDEFDALFLEKLSTTNLAQAVASYMGHREGCQFVHDAAAHRKIAPVVQAAIDEAAAAFQAEFPNLALTVTRNAKKAVTRIADPGLGDPVERICRDPLRKLGARERLIGPARLAVKHGLPHEHLVQAIAAALTYYDERDVQSKILQYIIADEGLDYVLTAVSGLLPHEPLAQEIKVAWAAMVQEKASALLQLNRKNVVERIIDDVVAEIAAEMENAVIAPYVREIADEFSSARITAFLPTLVRKRLNDRIGHSHLQPVPQRPQLRRVQAR